MRVYVLMAESDASGRWCHSAFVNKSDARRAQQRIERNTSYDVTLANVTLYRPRKPRKPAPGGTAQER